jgi:hypothetical protein
MTEIQAKINMELVATNVFTRWPCDICGGCTEKVSPLCEGVTPEGQGVRCCETCLQAGQDKIDERLQRHIGQYEPRVAFLKSLVGRVTVPTYAEWEEAQKAEDWEERVIGTLNARHPLAANIPYAGTSDIPF